MSWTERGSICRENVVIADQVISYSYHHIVFSVNVCNCNRWDFPTHFYTNIWYDDDDDDDDDDEDVRGGRDRW